MRYTNVEISKILDAKSEIKREYVIRQLLTDSRALSFPETTMFFALKTKTNDGHRYIGDLYGLGVRNFVVSADSQEYHEMTDANFIIQKDVLRALQRIAAHHRKLFSYPVIGITGSNGKTVVKELLYQLLHNDFNIVRSPRSYNSQIGVPLSVWEMDERHNLAIFEAGISLPNEMDRLRHIIAPTIGVITNIGEAHQKNFRSKEDKCREKLSLFADSQVIIYNADDEIVSSVLESSFFSHKILGWSRKNPDAALFVESIEKNDAFSTLRCKTMGITHDYVVPFTDDAFIEDVIHCLAVIFYLKPSEMMKKDEAFRTLEPVAMRLEVKDGIEGCQLINDTYNSDINSLAIALDFQQSRRADRDLRNTVILSDILQSGIWPEYLYGRVAELMRIKKTDRLIGIGKDISSCAKSFKGVREKVFYASTDDFIKAFRHSMFHNEMILIKGSRSFHFEKITELFEKKAHETILEVNLDAIIHNYNYFRSLLKPSTKIICMIKAFGYGVGAYELAKTLQDHRCDYLAVAVADEGAALRKEGISLPIIVMNPEMSSFNLLFEYRLEPEVYNFRLLNALVKETRQRGITGFPVHIKIDTGMHRLGFEAGEIPEMCRLLHNQNGIAANSVFTHLACSDDHVQDKFTLHQLAVFESCANEIEETLGVKLLKHALNSAGIERFTKYQYDMVRLGISLYGISLSDTNSSGKLQCVCRLKTVILQVRDVKKDESIGYGRRTVVRRNSRIAVIPIGYADGLDRKLSNGVGEVLIGGVRCPIVGNICMDACMVDITGTDAKEGDTVIVFNDVLTVEELAAKTGTIPYEILTSVSSRVKRVYYRE
ncbi:MAG: bifunctional UDP-N-acetylmuramoyl-tripeptide:D-alanyl-D-alanine ligase/alanine racemase [Tannerella sp.]|jgi:alanine racemase|nr:bifunctional UDP-N-acetylmuramoyl-tripeptide:D-alanyl-D-alanine ligase/alanine racemase [Tannerella sp.]